MFKCPARHIKRAKSPWWSRLFSACDSPRAPGLAMGFSGPSGTCQCRPLPSTPVTSPRSPSLPRGRGSTKRTMAVGTGLSPQTRPAMSCKSSCNVFLLQRAFQARDKRDEYYAGKVKLGSGMKSGHCLLHVSLGGVSCVWGAVPLQL